MDGIQEGRLAVIETVLQNLEQRIKGVKGWEDRLGSAIRAAWHWRLIAFGLLLILGYREYHYWQPQPEIVPYVYVVDADGRIIERGIPGPYTVTDVMVMGILEDWVKDCRERDPVEKVMATRWKRCAAMTRDQTKARGLINTYMDQEFPIIQKEKPRVEVTITVKFGLPTDHTYRLEWREVATLANGRVGSEREWAGEFTVELKPPRRLEEAKLNKLGVWLTEVHWGPRVMPGGA